MKRRTFIRNTTAAGIGCCLPFAGGMAHSSSIERRFHVCFSVDVLSEDPSWLQTFKTAGIDVIWLAGFFYGHWPYSLDKIQTVRQAIEKEGLQVNLVNVPLGHPGDSLGSKDGDFPLTPPPHWKLASRIDGTTYVGTSLHDPATQENVAAVRKLQEAGFTRIFLDDDFRLASSPGQIGGCFCPEHRDRFIRRGGYTSAQWDELLGDVRDRRLTPLLRDWVDFQCDELTGSFRAQQDVLKTGELGIMVMYLGSEKAGIRLSDYGEVPFRVGELMFDDASFGRVKGKTDELFSALFHRRFASPERAYSETTAFPANSLSARHLAAKLTISTIADVCNTMFMSGITPFPRSHWDTIGPAMKDQATAHRKLAGHVPRGPFKHYWGESSRMIGDDRPYSLFLAAGIPFEVTDRPAQEGWTFLSDFDARAVAEKKLVLNGTTGIHRPTVQGSVPGGVSIEESLDALFAFKQRIKSQLIDTNTPFIEQDVPVVCAWYPTARSVMLWNLSEDTQLLTLNYKQVPVLVEIPGLDSALIEGLS